MPGPPWEDTAGDLPQIGSNAAALVASIASNASARPLLALADVLDWHQALYDKCAVPVPGYVGTLRGDSSVPELADYEVGVGAIQHDGLPDRVGVPARDVAAEVASLFPAINGALTHLDGVLAPGQRPSSVAELDAVVSLAAVVHGEWIRIHPFVNGNGRTARTWVAFIALRYGLPVFLNAKPRPGDVAYARASRQSMGRPPDYVGDHSAAKNVFAHLLTLSLLP